MRTDCEAQAKSCEAAAMRLRPVKISGSLPDSWEAVRLKGGRIVFVKYVHSMIAQQAWACRIRFGFAQDVRRDKRAGACDVRLEFKVPSGAHHTLRATDGKTLLLMSAVAEPR